jgi:uncharacterized protein (DUF1501 family)
MPKMSQRTGQVSSRRRALLALMAAAGIGVPLESSWAQAAPVLGHGRLVVIFLRGAYDGLSAFVPYADPDYYRLRGQTAIPAPDGSLQTALRLDGVFGMHPALAPLMPLWQQGQFAFLPAAGSPDPSRSHFDAQHHWEIAIPGKNSAAPGWLNTLAHLGSSSGQPVAIGVGESNPQILAGPATVQLIPRGPSATRQGALANDRARTALLDLYSGQDALSQAFRQGARSRMQTAQTLSNDMAMAEMMAADNGAGSATGLPLDAQHLVTLMRQNRNLRLAFLSAGGWDTHANQGGVNGQIATNLAGLASAIVQLRREFVRPADLILVISEFGRTCAENGTRGTDHGHGNAMWLIGARVNGGRWHGQWDGLAQGQLNEGRDLPVHHDFRAVLAQLFKRNFGLDDAGIASVLPGARWDPALDRLFKF